MTTREGFVETNPEFLIVIHVKGSNQFKYTELFRDSSEQGH